MKNHCWDNSTICPAEENRHIMGRWQLGGIQNRSTAKLPPVADLFRIILLNVTVKEEDTYILIYLFIHTPLTFSLWPRAVFFLSWKPLKKKKNQHFQMSKYPESVYLYYSLQVYPPVINYPPCPLKTLFSCHRPLNSPLNRATQHKTSSSFKSLLLFIFVNIIPVLTCSEDTLNSAFLLWNTLSAV